MRRLWILLGIAGALALAFVLLLATGITTILPESKELASDPAGEPATREPLSSRASTAKKIDHARPAVAATDKAGNDSILSNRTLPPVGTPVAVILPELEQRARQGDIRAACRAAMEKIRCSRVMTMPPPAETVASNPEIGAEYKRNAELCAGVEAGRTNDAWRFLSQAALGGNVAAMSLFARSPGLEQRPPIEAAEGWLIYRDNAKNFLGRAIEGGDAMALYYSWFTSATGLAFAGPGVFEKDARRALVYGTAAVPLLDETRREQVVRNIKNLRETMNPNEAQLASEEGELLRKRYFSMSRPTLPSGDDTYLAPADCEK